MYLRDDCGQLAHLPRINNLVVNELSGGIAVMARQVRRFTRTRFANTRPGLDFGGIYVSEHNYNVTVANNTLLNNEKDLNIDDPDGGYYGQCLQ
jgi:hypothetical protein